MFINKIKICNKGIIPWGMCLYSSVDLTIRLPTVFFPFTNYFTDSLLSNKYFLRLQRFNDKYEWNEVYVDIRDSRSQWFSENPIILKVKLPVLLIMITGFYACRE